MEEERKFRKGPKMNNQKIKLKKKKICGHHLPHRLNQEKKPRKKIRKKPINK
jgi:hypothetical protein